MRRTTEICLTKHVGRTDLPCHKTDCFDNGWLDDLFSWEHAPCNSVGTIRVCVCSQITTVVDYVVSNIAVVFDMFEKEGHECGVHEELQVRLVKGTSDLSILQVDQTYFLVNIAIGRTPAEHFVVAPSTIHSWLGIDRQEAQFVHFCQLLGDCRCLDGRYLVRPWKCREVPCTETGEEIRNFRERCWLAP